MASMRIKTGYIWIMLIVAGATLGAVAAATLTEAGSPYYNSSEPGCDGSDSNVLFCDDFEMKANSTGDRSSRCDRIRVELGQ